MTEVAAADLIARLRRAGALIEPGLTDDEAEAVEAHFDFEFSDSHRSFLQAGLPVDRVPQERNRGWPDWRHGDPEQLRARLDKVIEGVAFDILHNDFWPAKWGGRPDALTTAEAVGREHLRGVPRLIPLHGNRYLPAGTGPQSPVISAYQTDVVHLAVDLADWIKIDFEELTDHRRVVPKERRVPFWSDIAEGVDPPYPTQPQLLNWPTQPEPLDLEPDRLEIVSGTNLLEQLKAFSKAQEKHQTGPKVVVDDLRTFPWIKHNVSYARTSAQAIDLLQRLHESRTHIGLLSLDYHLGTAEGGLDDTIQPVLDWMVDNARRGTPLDVTEIGVHTTNSLGEAIIRDALEPWYDVDYLGASMTNDDPRLTRRGRAAERLCVVRVNIRTAWPNLTDWWARVTAGRRST